VTGGTTILLIVVPGFYESFRGQWTSLRSKASVFALLRRDKSARQAGDKKISLITDEHGVKPRGGHAAIRGYFLDLGRAGGIMQPARNHKEAVQ
jgi:hypothetical protein